MRLKNQAESYEFGDNRENRILEQFIQTIEDGEMITKAIQKQWNLNKFFRRSKSKTQPQARSKRNDKGPYKHY